MENVGYSARIGKYSRILRIDDAWYFTSGAKSASKIYNITSEKISDDILKITLENVTDHVTYYNGVYLTGVPDSARWIASGDGKTGIFEYDGSYYLTGGYCELAKEVSAAENADGSVSISMDTDFLIPPEGVKASPDHYFFYNGQWYSNDDEFTLSYTYVGENGYGQYYAYEYIKNDNNLLAEKYSPEIDEGSVSAEDVEEIDCIAYDKDKGWILKYEDGSISPVSKVEKIDGTKRTFVVYMGNSSPVIKAERVDGTQTFVLYMKNIYSTYSIVNCQEKDFLALCDKLYYGRSGLEGFEYKCSDGAYDRGKYILTGTGNIARAIKDEDQDQYYRFTYEHDTAPTVEIKPSESIVVVNGTSYNLNRTETDNNYLCYSNDSGAEWIINWSKEDLKYLTELSADSEWLATNSSVGNEGGYDGRLYKGKHPYVNAILFKLSDGYWYRIDGNYDIDEDNIEGLPAKRLVKAEDGFYGEEDDTIIIEKNGILTNLTSSDFGFGAETQWSNKTGLAGINHMASDIQWYVTSDFKYYDITETGDYRKIPAWFQYEDQDYVTYDGYSAIPIHLVDAANNVFSVFLNSKWFYSDWSDNHAAVWLTKTTDEYGHCSGWFMYNDEYYYTKDGRSAKKYVKAIPINAWTVNFALEGYNDRVEDQNDYSNWQQDISTITTANNSYYSSKAVSYAL